ncbi:DNA-binding protein [Oceanimonas baumannii]|uniref:DNA-binding protein n=1 Tax=Oceanimonas baumannii TaxID=129578 RepID=UPI001D18B377|nr:DNA-binding protein [Oceanimonas baumannii]MCC4266172.1 DNA-binding protein [Oceanimonas baumannii]
MQGLFIRGRILGARQQSFNGRNGPMTRHEIGLALSRPNGFGGHQEEQLVIRIPSALVQAGVANQANSMVDRQVEIPVWVEAWAGQRGANVTYHLSNEGGIREVEAE